jgi:hypothetical protein
MKNTRTAAPVEGGKRAVVPHHQDHPEVIGEQSVDVIDDMVGWTKENIQLRTWVGLLLFVLASAMCLRAFSLGSNSASGGLLLNLGTELIGMLLTVVLVERLFEEHNKRQDARRLAMQFLHEVDDVVWVWQGGRRQFSSIELKKLLFEAIRMNDPIAPCTARRLMNLGDFASRTRRTDSAAVKCSEPLSRGLRNLEAFVQLRDPGYDVPPREIGKRLARAVRALAAAAEVRKYDSVFSPPPGSRNASIEEQERRDAGGHLNLRVRKARLPSAEG